MYPDDELLALSGLQHYAFCPRQWALIHIERQWEDNFHTIQGNLAHRNAHNEALRERRGDKLVVRGLAVSSSSMGLYGKCDVVEFHSCDDGFPIHGEDGLWCVLPVEYKKGRPKQHDADRLQVCAQAMCLEEMFCCNISEAVLFYKGIHERETVALDEALRRTVRHHAQEMHRLFERRYTPKAKLKSVCKTCSLVDVCLPEAKGGESAYAYLKRRIGELR